jgi:ketosteroid isomerase-like protein
MGNNRDLVEETYRRIEAGDWESLKAQADPDITFTSPYGPMHGPDQVADFMRMWRTAFPDLRFTTENAIETGDVVVLEGHFTGTHRGPLASPQGEVPATGRPVSSAYCNVFEIRDGKVAAFRGYADTLEIMAQLGLMPEPAQA